LEQGRDYSVVVTTGAGLWRCRLHDEVRVTGFIGATPCLEFLGRDNAVSDWVGEKLSDADAAVAISDAIAKTGVHLSFAMLVPWQRLDDATAGYDLVFDVDDGLQVAPRVADALATAVDTRLCELNYHYGHARRIGQLQPVCAEFRAGAQQAYLATAMRADSRIGTLKIPALDLGGRLRR
jgi:hypothetical protein